ncbi:hypothetical protein K402DRAFT_401828 [Aulographum hederae CBS 113979]|uniref:Nudix hydrolase domain-containing protein n=1 Tax=Aulographum hederae CBS 113979 TaxID=1176131 RepID=A0A6G1H925_9PEZI|nr:hypothetical protein K402DRAFT_401828 [Aulographum hederae CBS 113979]
MSIQQAIARLRAYVPPPSRWDQLPLARRAAVLIVLFADRFGDLRVVLTMRAATLKSYAGQAALPGGKSDDLTETPFQTARREAFEEIGLPLKDSQIPGFRVEHLCQLPMNLARTELGVMPCVAYLSAKTTAASPSSSLSTTSSTPITKSINPPPTVEESLIPRLDPKEVAAVFSAPFHNFLRAVDEVPSSADGVGAEAAGFPADWYKGDWTQWHQERWRMHNFYVPVAGQTVARPTQQREVVAQMPYGAHPERRRGKKRLTKAPPSASMSTSSQPPSSTSTSPLNPVAPLNDDEDPLSGLSRFRVFGMTARILVDAARVAYAEEPEFEHNSHFGDEEMIGRLMRMGRLGPVRQTGDEVTREDLIAASKI